MEASMLDIIRTELVADEPEETQAGTLPCPQDDPILCMGGIWRRYAFACCWPLACPSPCCRRPSRRRRSPGCSWLPIGPSTISPSCAPGGSNGVENARGRIAMDFGGDACDGYTLKYRQVTVLDSSEIGLAHPRHPDRDLRGRRRPLDALQVHLVHARGCSRTARSTAMPSSRPGRRPRRRSQAAEERGVRGRPAQPVFPTEHLKRLIEAGRTGRHDPVGQGL